MKINCGLTRLERWDAEDSWHPWFAWRPVRVGSRDCRWLEVIERRYVPPKMPGYFGGTWEYRA